MYVITYKIVFIAKFYIKMITLQNNVYVTTTVNTNFFYNLYKIIFEFKLSFI